MNDAMSMSHTGLKMMMQAEGLRLEAYPDPGTGAEPWTVGFGHTGPDVKPGMTITKEQAEMLLRDDVRFAEIGVRSYTTVPLTQSQFNTRWTLPTTAASALCVARPCSRNSTAGTTLGPRRNYCAGTGLVAK